MTGQQLIRIVFSFLPFVVCLFWTICFLVQCRKTDGAKRFFMSYIFTCTLLYLCHALFFTIGISYEVECFWTLCSLSVYPLFYAYLCRLTTSDFSLKEVLPWLVPGAITAVAKYAFPDYGIDNVRLVIFILQIVCTCYYGIRKLNAFDKKLKAVYVDTDKRDTTAVHHLLIALIAVSILAGVANTIGKGFFGESLWLLIPVSLAFSTLLFSLSYICFHREFTVDLLTMDEIEDVPTKEEAGMDEPEQIGIKIERLMVVEHYFLKKDLKIGDVVKEIGSNRTYVSNYINRTYHCSFSDYMNNLRIEYAKQLLASSSSNTKLSLIADESGFANEQSFYRNFKKFVGMTPAEWFCKKGCLRP